MFVMDAFEFGEQFLGQLAQSVHQHVQAPAMRHADDGLFHALLARALQQMMQQRDQRLAAFQREAFLPDVFGVQITLQPFCRRQAFEDAFLRLGADSSLRRPALPVWLVSSASARCR